MKKKQAEARKKQRLSKDYKDAQKAKKQSYKCSKCMQPFANTSSETTLRQHVESKHSGKNGFTFDQCFPTWGQDIRDDDKNKKAAYKNKKKKSKR